MPTLTEFVRTRGAAGFGWLPALIAGLLVYKLWSQVYFTYSNVPFWVALAAMVVLLLVFRAVPSLLWLFWFGGVMTVFLGFTPGNSISNGLWELLYLGAFAAGRWRRGYWLLGSALLINYGFGTSLLLNIFDLVTYNSGSTHYVTGAQALTLVPLSFYFAINSRTGWRQFGFASLLLASLFISLISGARAVYLPLLIILILCFSRQVYQKRQSWSPVLFLSLYVVLGLLFLDMVIPNQPMRSALDIKIEQSTREGPLSDDLRISPPSSTQSIMEMGAVQSRLLMWDQSFRIALSHPFGTGTGSFRDTIAAFQRYPYISFASPHNYYLETLVTGGWLRLLLLLALLWSVLWPAWRDPERWPWALGAAGIWATLAFDVTGYYPSFMMLAFWTLGAAKEPQLETVMNSYFKRPKMQKTLSYVGIASALGLMLWWYLPCSSYECATSRYFGLRNKVLPLLADLGPNERTTLLERSRELNPKSIWVVNAQYRYADTQEERLALSRTMTKEFPYSSPQIYLNWADDALALGRQEETRTAIMTGLELFPSDTNPAGIPLILRSEVHARWLREADRILAELDAQ